MISGVYVLLVDGHGFIWRLHVNIHPDAETLASIVETPRISHLWEDPIAMLSYSDFMTTLTKAGRKAADAVRLIKAVPELTVDGEMQADTAVNRQLAEQLFHFPRLRAMPIH